MKILFTYYIPSGGVETLNCQRDRVLAKHGVECHFLYQWSNPSSADLSSNPSSHPPSNSTTNPSLTPSSSSSPPPLNPSPRPLPSDRLPGKRLFITDEDAAIKSLLQAERYDAVIVTSNYLMLERLRRLGYTGPVIYECQGLGTIEEAMGTLLEALPYIHTCSDAVLYPRTDHMQRLFHALYPDIKKFSFHNCLDPQLFSYRTMPQLEGPVIGWVGRIERNKNWRAFLRMAKAWIKQRPQLNIWMFYDAHVYEEDEMADFERALQSLDAKLSRRLIRRTNVPLERMADYYSQIGDSGGFVCSTSVTEGFGYALLEAMSCCCPVLASDSDGPRSFIMHNRTGKMYSGEDERSGIREGLAYLQRPTLRDNIRRRGQQHVRQHFSPETYAGNFLDMLKQIDKSR